MALRKSPAEFHQRHFVGNIIQSSSSLYKFTFTTLSGHTQLIVTLTNQHLPAIDHGFKQECQGHVKLFPIRNTSGHNVSGLDIFNSCLKLASQSILLFGITLLMLDSN